MTVAAAMTDVETTEGVAGWLDVEGCFNVRDAGGWATSDGRSMRAGTAVSGR